MLKKSVAICAFVLAATPAFADAGSCYEPIPPAALDGTAVSEQQMKSGLVDVKNFIGQSDDYQNCLIADLAAQKRAAHNQKDKDKQTLDPSVEAGIQAKIDTNQKLKEKVGAEYNAAAVAYNKAHPKSP